MAEAAGARRLRVAFMGTPGFAAAILARLAGWDGAQVVGVYTQPDRPCGRGLACKPSEVKALALELGLPVFQPVHFKDPGAKAELAALAPDVLAVAAYGLILPQAVLDIPRLAPLNVHASLLPRHRGAAPIQRAILEGDRETGVTIMRMVRELDAGDMLLSRTTPIAAEDTAQSLHDRLADMGGEALCEALALLAAGKAQFTPQDPALATFAPKLAKDEGRMDWTRPAAEVHDRVRAMHPWPGAFFVWDQGGAHKPLRLGLAPGRVGGPVPAGAQPGTILGVEEELLAIACADRLYLTPWVQPEGRKRQDPKAFLCGYLDRCAAPAPEPDACRG